MRSEYMYQLAVLAEVNNKGKKEHSDSKDKKC